MPKITLIEHNGSEHSITALEGETLLRVALDNGISGILGDCGGNCSCATCHVYIEGPMATLLPKAVEDEQVMLDGALHLQDNSRLACQIVLTPQLDGLVARMPASQI
jgi:2Fe-2S ferredoxin